MGWTQRVKRPLSVAGRRQPDQGGLQLCSRCLTRPQASLDGREVIRISLAKRAPRVPD